MEKDSESMKRHPYASFYFREQKNSIIFKPQI